MVNFSSGLNSIKDFNVILKNDCLLFLFLCSSTFLQIYPSKPIPIPFKNVFSLLLTLQIGKFFKKGFIKKYLLLIFSTGYPLWIMFLKKSFPVPALTA